MSPKKIFWIVLFALVILGAGYGLYYSFFRTAFVPEVTPVTNAPTTGGALPSAGEGGTQPGVRPSTPLPGGQPITGGAAAPAVPVVPTVDTVAKGGVTVTTPVVAAPTAGAAVSTGGQVSYYNRDDGKVYRLAADGTVQPLSNKTFNNVSTVSFDPNGDKAIMTYPDGAKTVFDFNTNTQVTLPKHWEDLAWSAGGDQIIAKSLGMDAESRFLVVTSPDGQSAKAIQELGDNADKVTVAWSPNNQVVAFSATGEPCGFECGELFLIGQNKENYKTLKVPGLGFIPKWTPGGNELMFSVSNAASDWKPQLWLVDADGNNIGKNRRSINVNTWADKCTFSDASTALCAVPRSLPRGAGLNRAVAADEPDDLYKIDLDSGSFSRIAIPEGQHTITNLSATPDGQKLYFNDANSSFLYSVDLK
jgi:WD40 repeat protein